MKIKVKLTLGVGLLFLFIILLSALSSYYINALNKDTQNILVANYNTLNYSRNMLIALDEDFSNPVAINKFAENLFKQQKNITEIGEKELTENLAADFEKLKLNPKDSLQYSIIRKDLTDIMLLNMQAIQRKSDIAKQTATIANWWIAVTGTICFLIAFILLINLPGSIANPIKELTESIKQIAAKNYKERVHFEGHNEFGELAGAFNVMAEKLEEYDTSKLAKILFEKKRIEALINNMHDPVIGFDENFLILFANEEALKVVGMKEEDFVGKNAKEIALKNDLLRYLIQDTVLSSEINAKASQKPLKIYADNKESYFDKEVINISITPTGEKIPRHIGYVFVLRNITPFKELDFAKTNFIATISHELKTPISSIKMSLQLLENEQIGKLNAEQENLVESIKEDTSRLLKITGELLNMTQIESGNIHLSILPANPSEILQYAVKATKNQAEQKHVDLEISSPEKLPNIQADSEKTAWVLTNLLSNAIRYSPENSKVFVRIVNKNSKIRFEVEDKGPGIAPQYKSKIFDRYFRVPGTIKEGTGLGLSISKEFIEAQGGHISLESVPGKGSTFVVELNIVV